MQYQYILLRPSLFSGALPMVRGDGCNVHDTFVVRLSTDGRLEIQ